MKELTNARKVYAVKHKTIPDYYLTGGVSGNRNSPRIYTTQGKAEGARKRQWQANDLMVVEWTISEKIVPWQQELPLQELPLQDASL